MPLFSNEILFTLLFELLIAVGSGRLPPQNFSILLLFLSLETVADRSKWSAAVQSIGAVSPLL